MAFSLLVIAIVAAAAAPRPAVAAKGRDHAAHGCQAAGPGGDVATFDAADIAAAAHPSAAAPGLSTGAGTLATPATQGRPIRAAFTFARPHDPAHLHAFSLLI
jgi:hypothetical protein